MTLEGHPVSSRRFPVSGGLHRALLYGLLLCYSLAFGLSVAMGRWVALVLVVAPLLCALVYLQPGLGLALTLAVFYLGERLVGLGYLPQAIEWLPDLVVLALLFRVLVMARRRHIDPGGPVAWAAIALGILAVASALVNGMDLTATIVGLRYLFRFVALYFAIINLGLSRASLRRLVNALVIIALAQVPICLAQFWVHGSVGDTNSGTMQIYGGEEMAFVCTASAVILLSLYFQGSRRLWPLLAAAALMIPGLAAGARGASLVFFPLALLLALVLNLRRPGRALARRVGVAGFLFALIAALMVGSSVFGTLLSRNTFSGLGEVIATESISGLEFGRLTSVENAASMVKEEPLGAVVGLGPGATGKNQFAFGRAREMVSVTGAFRVQVAASIVELGYPGLAVMLAIPLLTLLGLPPLRAYRDPYWVALRIAVPGVLLMYVVYFSYYAIWIGGASSILLWMLVAAVRATGRQSMAVTA